MTGERERRRHTRLSMGLEVRIHDSRTNRTYVGQTRDLSQSGMYVLIESAVFLPSSLPLVLEIVIPGLAEGKIEINAKCVRTDENGYAIQYISATRRNHQLYREFIRNHANDPDKTKREYEKNPVPPVVD